MLLLNLLLEFCLAERVRHFKWSVTQFLDAPDGVTRSVLGINGKPGYDTSIIVDQGDTVIVDVTNLLDVPTAIHWHGYPSFNIGCIKPALTKAMAQLVLRNVPFK